MQQTKVIALLRSFSTHEMKAFENFLLSPYFNQSTKLVRLFKLIEPYHPGFESDRIKKEKIYKLLHGGKADYNDATMRELISDLFKQARIFIAHEQLRKDNLEASMLRYQWLHARQLAKLSEAEIEQHRALVDNHPVHDHHYYHHRRQQDIKKFEFVTEQSQGSEDKLMQQFDFFATVHSLNREYLINCLTIHIYLLTLSNIYKFTLDQPMLKQIETLALLYINRGDIVLDLYFNIFKLAQTREEAFFFELKKRLFQKDRRVPLVLMHEAGINLENFCLGKIRLGEDKFTHEVMEIYRFEADNNLLTHNNSLSYILYCNIAARGAQTGEIAWTDTFIEQNKKLLPEEYRDDVYAYAKAHVLFGGGNYKEALKLSLSCNIPFFVVKILLRNLVARIQYELDMLDELQILLRSMQHHLKDEKLTEDRRQHLQTFITMMRQLCELKGNYNRPKLEELSNKLEMHKGFADKKWFREKLMEIQKR